MKQSLPLWIRKKKKEKGRSTQNKAERESTSNNKQAARCMKNIVQIMDM